MFPSDLRAGGSYQKRHYKSARRASSPIPAHSSPLLPVSTTVSPSRDLSPLLGPQRKSMSSLFSSEKPDLVSFSPRLSVRAWRLMILPPAETVPGGATDARVGCLCTGVGGAPASTVAVRGSELSRRWLGI